MTTFEQIFDRRKKILSQTPEINDMGVSSSHPQKNTLETGGLDRLDISLYGLWPPGLFIELASRLKKARQKAERGLDGSYIVTSEGDRIEVAPTGVKHGVYCRYSMRWNGCQIDVVDNASPSEKRLSVFVSIGSITLMKIGHQRAWDDVKSLLTCLGFETIRDVVSRVDLCVDLPDVSMRPVQECVEDERIICRAGKYGEFGTFETMETYYRGKGPMLVRIYDKANEVKDDPIKKAVMVKMRWGDDQEKAVRVEFQLRRKTLAKRFSIQSTNELFKNLGTISKWSTEKWFRLTDRRVDRKNKNQSRAKNCEFWQTVQAKFRQWTIEAIERKPMKESEVVPDFQALEKQAIGCISKIAAHKDGASFFDAAIRILKEYKKHGQKSTDEKRVLLASLNRVLIDDSEIPF